MLISPDGRFHIKEAAPGVGLGLFALQLIRQGDFVLEYTGPKVPTATAERDTWSRYLFVIDDEWTIDGRPPANIAGYINHGCEPNCEARLEDGHLMIYALQDIAAGVEITLDYGPEYFEDFIAPIGCRCASCFELG